jgi:hypothetical protein
MGMAGEYQMFEIECFKRSWRVQARGTPSTHSSLSQKGNIAHSARGGQLHEFVITYCSH